MINSLKKIIKNIFFPEFIGYYNDFSKINSSNSYSDRKFVKVYLENHFYKCEFNYNYDFHPGLKTIANHIHQNKKKIKILDLGGGYGTVYRFLKSKKFNTSKNFIITLFETDKMIKEIKKIIKKNKIKIQMKLISKLKKEKFDIIYLGSSLQYFEHYKKILNYLSDHSDNIIMDDIPISNKNTFACLQVNAAPLKLSAWVFSRYELINYFKLKKYKIVYTHINPRVVAHKKGPDKMIRKNFSIYLIR